MSKDDYAVRDKDGQAVFYVLLWKRKGMALDLFDDYWRNVHGPVCARLPGQYQYWQLHVAHNHGGVWPGIPNINYATPADDQFDGIAELTFRTEADRTTWFQAAGILMDDEHNLFRRAIGYNTSPGNSKTYVDRIPAGDPNGALGIPKFHVMVRKSDAADITSFRNYLKNTFAPAVASSDSVLKLRLHLFEEVDASRPDAAGVAHAEPREHSYEGAFEIAFANRLDMENFFASNAYAAAVKDQARYIKQISPFPERSAYTFVYNGQMTLAGQRSSTVAELIVRAGAVNQLRADISNLMLGGGTASKAGT
jgi:hypothetical protein